MMQRSLIPILFFFIALAVPAAPLLAQGATSKPSSRPWTVLCLGDSITEGLPGYRPYLKEMLQAAGANIEYLGPRVDKLGLRHAGFSGKNAEFLDERFADLYAADPADVLLIHAGHNHFTDENPINGIIAANESIINNARQINPRVIILLAKVTTAGKLPKYAYLPDLNVAIGELADRLNAAGRPVTLVDQGAIYDWKVDAKADHVHPTEGGARKMAQCWFDALAPLIVGKSPPAMNAIDDLPATSELASKMATRTLTYKTVGDLGLEMNVYEPADLGEGERRPAMLIFHGGGWVGGSASAFASEALYFSRRGMVTITADYRLLPGGRGEPTPRNVATSPTDCLNDAESAMRYLREHAEELHVDPNRIVASGGSAGGHLAMALATISTDESVRPNALLLFYPAIDLVDGWKGGRNQAIKAGLDPDAFSPARHIPRDMVPTLILSGGDDPISTSPVNQKVVETIDAAGGTAKFVEFAGRAHVFYGRSPNHPWFRAALFHSSRFLESLGYIPADAPLPEPAVEERVY